MTADRTQVTCQQLVELATDYLEGLLDPERVAALDAHLELCDGCDVYIEQMRQTVIALRGLANGEAVSAETRDAILTAFATRARSN
jgi:anti-sigma factor RsiW